MSITRSDEFVIKSSVSDIRLVLSELRDEYFTAAIRSAAVTATRPVCTYTDSHGLLNLLQNLSEREKPWEGEKVWSAIEGDFEFTATCSSLGKVTFKIEMRQYGKEDWFVRTELVTEMGQLVAIASDAKSFFGPSPY